MMEKQNEEVEETIVKQKMPLRHCWALKILNTKRKMIYNIFFRINLILFKKTLILDFQKSPGYNLYLLDFSWISPGY